MWYKLALVRPIPGDGPSTSGYFSGVCLSHPAEGSVVLAATVCAGVHIAHCIVRAPLPLPSLCCSNHNTLRGLLKYLCRPATGEVLSYAPL